MTPLKPPIILLSGGTGVGTSTISFEVAKLLGIPTIIGTDTIREIIRSILRPGVYPTLEKSTYLAGQTAHYHGKSSQVKKAEIIRAYKTQCAAINKGVEGVIQRALEENTPLIVEGVHLLPGKLQESELYAALRDRLEEYSVFVSNPKVHKNRFVSRQRQAPDRRLDKYLAHLYVESLEECFKLDEWVFVLLFPCGYEAHHYFVCCCSFLISESSSYFS